MDRVEAFFNWQNDWHWGPFEFLRPPKNVNIDRRRFAWVCALGVPMTMLGLTLALLSLGAYFAHQLYDWQPSLPVLWRGTEYIVQRRWGLLLFAGALFPLGWWPYAYFWNRRAARLRRTPPADPVAGSQAGVWPPSPKRS